MILSEKAQSIYLEISREGTKLGDLRKIANEIRKDQSLGEELWNTRNFHARLLAILVFDTKELQPDVIDRLFKDAREHSFDERIQLADWLMANQLTKDKKLIALIQSWQDDPSALKRRIFWYYQGRLRWVGQTPPANTRQLLHTIEEKMPNEEPEVQWAMNFTAAWIGIFDKTYRNECINMGEKLGLYRDEIVAKNCTPNYLPKFIELEVKKRNL